MVFSSLFFTFFFLPVTLLLYFLAKEQYRNYILLAMSLLFYAYGEPWFILAMMASVLANYLLALMIGDMKVKKAEDVAKGIMILAVILNLGMLFVFKYLDYSCSFANSVLGMKLPEIHIALPIGISFFTFQALSYVLDVYRGNVAVQKNLCYLALYISFFPQLIAGPIVRYSTIEHQIADRKITPEGFGEGARRFLLGFCKKVILANNLSMLSAAAFDMGDGIVSANPLFLWLGAIGYSLQIFYDFSGYSDMAIGLGRMFGFRFEENFNYPYISASVTEFWRRWHISLGQWFRDYVYIPLGGSRVTVPRHLMNMFIVWILTGIWHGANLSFVVWGLWYFLLLVVEKYLVKPERRKSAAVRLIWRVVTLLCVNFGWVIFNAGGITKGIRYCLAMIGYYGTYMSVDSTVIYYLREYGFFLAAGILCATPVMGLIGKRCDRTDRIRMVRSVACPLCYGALFLWAVSFLILGAHNPFIYFNF